MLQNKNIIDLASAIIQASGFIPFTLNSNPPFWLAPSEKKGGLEFSGTTVPGQGRSGSARPQPWDRIPGSTVPKNQLTSVKSLPLLLDYGYCLEFNPASQVLNIRVRREYLLSVYAQLDNEIMALKSRTPPVIIPESEIQKYKKVCKIRLSTKTLVPAVFYAIYYKCIELGILFIDLNSRPAKYNFGKAYKFIYSWNNLCQQVNNLLNLYIPEETEADHGLISILLAEINSTVKIEF